MGITWPWVDMEELPSGPGDMPAPPGGIIPALPGYHALTIYAIGDGIVRPASGNYRAGTVVSLTAVPESGNEFDRWSGGAAGENTMVNVTMDGPKIVYAYFESAAQPIPTPGPTPPDDTQPYEPGPTPSPTPTPTPTPSPTPTPVIENIIATTFPGAVMGASLKYGVQEVDATVKRVYGGENPITWYARDISAEVLGNSYKTWGLPLTINDSRIMRVKLEGMGNRNWTLSLRNSYSQGGDTVSGQGDGWAFFSWPEGRGLHWNYFVLKVEGKLYVLTDLYVIDIGKTGIIGASPFTPGYLLAYNERWHARRLPKLKENYEFLRDKVLPYCGTNKAIRSGTSEEARVAWKTVSGRSESVIWGSALAPGGWSCRFDAGSLDDAYNKAVDEEYARNEWAVEQLEAKKEEFARV